MSFVTDLYVEGRRTNLTVCQIPFCKAVGHLQYDHQILCCITWLANMMFRNAPVQMLSGSIHNLFALLQHRSGPLTVQSRPK